MASSRRFATPLLSRATIDRAAYRRLDADWLESAWGQPQTRVFGVHDGTVLVQAQADPGGTLGLVFVAASDSPQGDRFFLGVDEQGTAYFAVASEHEIVPQADTEADARPAGLREAGGLLGDRDAGLMVHAVALERWHATHRFCPRCGAPTKASSDGHVRRCSVDGSEHYPRTDPAVIMLVIDAQDRCLLGTQASWPARRFSTLAGFVEPGEAAEQAVRREVAEEVGVLVGEVTYLASQPWPFPSSLMLGFHAQVAPDAEGRNGSEGLVPLHVDGEEITEARWFTRDELGAAAESGEILLPSGISIARRLVEHWYGAQLPSDNHW